MKAHALVVSTILLSSSLRGDAPAKFGVIDPDKAVVDANPKGAPNYRSYHKFLFGGITPGASFSREQGGQSATDVLSTGFKITSGSIHQNNAFAAYLESSRQRPLSNGGDVAGYFSAKSTGANTNIFGINPLVSDSQGFAGQSLQNELDFNVADARTRVQGLGLVLNSSRKMSSPPTGVVCRVANTTKWNRCFWVVDGAADVAIVIGATDKGNNVGSMPIIMYGRNADGKILSASVRADLKGSLLLRSGAADGAIGFQDGNGANTGYINANGMVIGKSIHSSSLGGLGNSVSKVIQSGAGKGATTSCAPGFACDSLSGTILLKTGNNILSSSDFLEVTFPHFRKYNPNCNVTAHNMIDFSVPQFGISNTTLRSITLRSGEKLASSSSYLFTYICGGT